MPRQGKNSEKDITSLGEVFIGVAGYSSRGTIVVSSHVYNFTEEKYGGNAASKLWIETVRSENKLALFLDDQNVDPSKFAQLRDGFNQFILTSHISQFVRTWTCIQGFSDAIAFIDRHGPLSPPHIAKLTPNEVAHIRIFNQVTLLFDAPDASDATDGCDRPDPTTRFWRRQGAPGRASRWSRAPTTPARRNRSLFRRSRLVSTWSRLVATWCISCDMVHLVHQAAAM